MYATSERNNDQRTVRTKLIKTYLCILHIFGTADPFYFIATFLNRVD
jgi:hypothetical protein